MFSQVLEAGGLELRGCLCRDLSDGFKKDSVPASASFSWLHVLLRLVALWLWSLPCLPSPLCVCVFSLSHGHLSLDFGPTPISQNDLISRSLPSLHLQTLFPNKVIIKGSRDSGVDMFLGGHHSTHYRPVTYCM